jgi:hypothetical protein
MPIPGLMLCYIYNTKAGRKNNVDYIFYSYFFPIVRINSAKDVSVNCLPNLFQANPLPKLRIPLPVLQSLRPYLPEAPKE